MIKSTSLSLGLFCAFASTAQITITSADMPNVNDSLFISTTASINLHDPAQTGADFSWDYSDLKPMLQMPQEFDPPAKFPSIYAFLFNSSNTSYGKNNPMLVAGTIPGMKINAAFDFYKKSDNSLNQVGIGFLLNDMPIPFIYQRPDVIYRFPMNYLNADSCNFNFGQGLPGLGYYGQRGHRHNLIDGWGELKTPLGTFTTLRVLSRVDITDTVYIEQDSNSFGFPIKRPTRYEYKWFAAGSKFPVLQIDVMTVNNQPVYTASFIDTLRKDIIHVGIDEIRNQQLSLHVYPNPVQDQFIIRYELNSKSPVQLIINDLAGKEVMAVLNENQTAGMHQQSVNVSGLQAGIYFVILRSGNDMSVQKLSIVH